jgi:hypothetical protein
MLVDRRPQKEGYDEIVPRGMKFMCETGVAPLKSSAGGHLEVCAFMRPIILDPPDGK